MRTQVEYLKERPDQEFTLQDIRKLRLFPWAVNDRTITKEVKSDYFGGNLLKASIEGEGRKIRYLIKGKNLIKYIETYGPYLMGKVRKSKPTIWQKRKSKSQARRRSSK